MKLVIGSVEWRVINEGRTCSGGVDASGATAMKATTKTRRAVIDRPANQTIGPGKKYNVKQAAALMAAG
jgi:hypothetical protein